MSHSKITKLEKDQRDEDIRTLYKEGYTQLELAQQFGLSKVRVGQILHQQGILKTDRPTSDRTEYTGIQLRPQNKEALRTIAKQEETSMSEFMSDLLESELKKRGVKFEPAENNDPKLPWGA